MDSFIGERRGGFGLRRWTPIHDARRRAQCASHCWAGQTLPVLTTASSDIGERQREVKGLETKMVVRFGTLGQAREASTREQSARRRSEHVDTHANTPGRTWSPRDL